MGAEGFFILSPSWWDESKQFHLRNLREKRGRRRSGAGVLCSPSGLGSSSSHPPEKPAALWGVFPLHKPTSMCHNKVSSFFILLNLLLPHLQAYFPRLNRHSILTSQPHRSPFFIHTPQLHSYKVLMFLGVKTKRLERGSYIIMKSTEEVYRSQLDLDRMAGFFIVSG